MEIELLNKVEETAEPIVEVLPPEPIIETMWVRQPTRDLLERYFAEKIMSLKHGLDEVYEPKSSPDGETLDQLASLKAYWNICRTEVGEMVDLFGEINPATMNPNHRKVMSISKHFLTLLEPLDPINEKKKDSKRCCEFAETAIKFLMSIHTCLHNNPAIKDKEKTELVKAFLKKECFVDGTNKTRKRKTERKDADGQQGE